MMDDNELDNEREKREHEINLAKLQSPRNSMESFWDMVNGNFFFIFLIICAVIAAIVKMKTGHDFSF